MIYTISIDWLALHCHYCPPVKSADLQEDFADPRFPVEQWQPHDTPTEERDLLNAANSFVFRYELAKYATRQFSQLWMVTTPNDEGGWDDFAEVQARPYSGILNTASVIVRFVNRVLYMPDLWARVEDFLSQNDFVFQGINRIDICADFNQFRDRTALQLIEGFASKKLRHIGQGIGALYFNHGVMRDEFTHEMEYGVQYTGLSFGTHTSDFRTYLYNKSFELLTQGEKPWIRDRWRAVGLDPQHVWRLEVSIKSGGCKFKDRTTGKVVLLDKNAAADDDELGKIFHTLVQKKFAFVVNHRGITNISREERIQLFDLHPVYEHRTIRNVSPGRRFEKMFIKALYQLGDLYRGADMKDNTLTAQALAFDIADTTDLTNWMSEKLPEWGKAHHK